MSRLLCPWLAAGCLLAAVPAHAQDPTAEQRSFSDGVDRPVHDYSGEGDASSLDLNARNTVEATPVEPVVDRNRSRNITATVALGFIIVSNAFTWLYYPVQEGFPAVWQTVGRYLLLYQQWAMFSVPSSLT